MVRIVFVMIVMMTSLMVSMVMIVLRSLGLKMVRVVLVNYDDDSDDDVNGDDSDDDVVNGVNGDDSDDDSPPVAGIEEG